MTVNRIELSFWQAGRPSTALCVPAASRSHNIREDMSVSHLLWSLGNQLLVFPRRGKVFLCAWSTIFVSDLVFVSFPGYISVGFWGADTKTGCPCRHQIGNGGPRDSQRLTFKAQGILCAWTQPVAAYIDSMAFGTYRRARHTYNKLLNGGKIHSHFLRTL